MVALDRLGDAVGAARLDHVGVERPLHEPASTSPSLRASSSKTRMNSSPMRLRFSSGSVTPASRARKRSCACDVDERHVEAVAERLDDLRGLVAAQQAVVDEDARELVADRLVHEQRRDRAVDAARERRRAPARGRPRARIRSTCSSITAAGVHVGDDAGDAVEEVLQHLLAVRRVHDLGVELDRRRGRARRPRTRRSASRPSRRRRARPSGGATTESRCDIQTVCSAARSRKSSLSPAAARSCRTRRRRAVDAAAELLRHQLHAVADAERRHAELEDRRVDRAARRRRRPRPGPPERISAAGLRRRSSSAVDRCETSSE